MIKLITYLADKWVKRGGTHTFEKGDRVLEENRRHWHTNQEEGRYWFHDDVEMDGKLRHVCRELTLHGFGHNEFFRINWSKGENGHSMCFSIPKLFCFYYDLSREWMDESLPRTESGISYHGDDGAWFIKWRHKDGDWYHNVEESGFYSIVYPKDKLFGKISYRRTVFGSPRVVSVKFDHLPPEECNLEYTLYHQIWKRPFWTVKEQWFVETKYLGKYPPVAFGKGENSWDCEDDILDNVQFTLPDMPVDPCELDVIVGYKSAIQDHLRRRGFNRDHYKDVA